MSDQLIQRAGLLLQQRKYKEAESILGGLFASNPANVQVIAMLCEVKVQQELYREALELANSAIGYAPSNDFLFYRRATVYFQLNKYPEAENDLQQAIALNPYEANYFAVLALSKLNRRQFQEACDLSEQALELDPENITALNARSTALLKLNRKEESFETIRGALREDPDNAYTHANYGWGQLEKGSNKEALKHFSMALQKDPTLKLAQAGMAEALKARYWLYRGFLRYSFWMSNRGPRFQWAFIIGIYLGRHLLESAAKAYPWLMPFVLPVIILTALFAFSTWIIAPVGNLFLRLNTYGRHLLSPAEKQSSNLVAASLLIAVAGGIAVLFLPYDGFIEMLILGITMMIPLSVMFNTKNNKVLVVYTGALALAGVAGIITTFVTGDLGNIFSLIYLVGIFLFQWVANFMITRENKK